MKAEGGRMKGRLNCSSFILHPSAFILPKAEGERVGERARAGSGSGGYDHPRGLFDDYDILVLVDVFERDDFGLDFRGGRLGQFHLDALARTEFVGRLRLAPAD